MVIKPGKPSIRVSHPEVAAQLHPTKNNGLTAEQIVAGSRKKNIGGSALKAQTTNGTRSFRIGPSTVVAAHVVPVNRFLSPIL